MSAADTELPARSPGGWDISRANAAVIIAQVGAPYLEDLRAMATDLGGAWTLGFEAWNAAQPHMPYVVLGAYTFERLAKRAPMIWLARDTDALGAAVHACCDGMDDPVNTFCAWVRFLKPDTLALVDRIIRHDSESRLAALQPKGRA